MSLEIECEKCGSRFVVEGYTTAASWTDPGEVITELELVDEDQELCGCLTEGESFAVVSEDHDYFDDDVL